MKQIKIYSESYWLYYIFAYLISWSIWGFTIIINISAETITGFILFTLGGLGPTFSTLICLRFFNDNKGRIDYKNQFLDYKTTPKIWFFIALFLNFVISLLSALFGYIGLGDNSAFDGAIVFFQAPLLIVQTLLFNFAAGSIEEVGWRGYALPRMQKKLTPLISSLLTSVLWASWHIPMYFMQDTYQNKVGFGSPMFWIFMIGFIPETLLFTWIFNHSKKCIWYAIFFHFSTNVAGEMFDLSIELEICRLIIYFIIAFIVLIKDKMYKPLID